MLFKMSIPWKSKKGRGTVPDKKTKEIWLLNAACIPGLDPELGKIAIKDILGAISEFGMWTVD